MIQLTPQAKPLKTYTYKSKDIYHPKDESFAHSFMKFFQSIGITLIKDDTNIKKDGEQMVVVMDGVASSKEATQLLQLANVHKSSSQFFNEIFQ